MALLEDAGHRVAPMDDGFPDLAGVDLVWMLGTPNTFPKIRRRLAAMPAASRPLLLVWHAELLPPPKAAGVPWPRLAWWEMARILRRDPRAKDVYTNYYRLWRMAKKGLPDLLVAPTLERCEFLAERGLSSHFVPLGHDPAMGEDLGIARDIEVLFLGSLNIPRRRGVLEQIESRGVNLLALGSRSDPACWGAERSRLLNRTKILLNISRSPGQFPDLRWLLGMANKSLVISEPVHAPDPYVPGKHYVSAPIEQLPEVIAYYLAHAEERERIAHEGHCFVTQELTMAHSVSRILELVKARMACPALRLHG